MRWFERKCNIYFWKTSSFQSIFIFLRQHDLAHYQKHTMKENKITNKETGNAAPKHGIGGAEMSFCGITIGGIGLAALVGVILNLTIPKSKTN